VSYPRLLLEVGDGPRAGDLLEEPVELVGVGAAADGGDVLEPVDVAAFGVLRDEAGSRASS
jgi:hypothetical protein